MSFIADLYQAKIDKAISGYWSVFGDGSELTPQKYKEIKKLWANFADECDQEVT